VDTEPRFGWEFKTISVGMRRKLQVGMLARLGWNNGPGVESPYAGSQDAGDLAAAFIGSQRQGISVGSHGTSNEGSAHSDLRLATGRLSGGIQIEERSRAPYPVNYPVRVRFNQQPTRF
jgi:hypothetical protein